MGWVENPVGPPSAGVFLATFFRVFMQKILSVFIDESGDFGAYNSDAPFYLITMVFHEQLQSITQDLDKLDESLRLQGFLSHSLHTGPLIRKEEQYFYLSLDERRKIFNSFISFTRHVQISYKTFILEKRPNYNDRIMGILLSQMIREYLNSKEPTWRKYEEIIVYYDNGQTQLTHIIKAVFDDPRALFRTVKPSNYRLFQVADLLTTLELINLKKQNKSNSKSEISFFGSMNKFHKNYYKAIEQKQNN